MERDTFALDSLLRRTIEKEGYPGVAVCIRGPEGVIFEKGYGYKSLKRKTPVDGNTVFGLASMSKSFTTLACCILATEGKLSLDDPITKYFPKLHIPGVPDELVTLKLIGMHRAGFPPMEPLEWSIAMNSKERDTELHKILIKSAPNKMDTIDQIVEYMAKAPYGSLGQPGEYMSYSNEGYALLSYVVDMAAGVTLEEFLDERIFKPLGMTRSILDLDCTEARKRAGDDNITSLYEKAEDGSRIEDDDWSVLPPFRGCACVKSTALDVTKYYQMLSNGGVFEGKRIIPEEAVELLIGSAFPRTEETFYCLGLKKSIIGGRTVCDHGGELHGVSTHGGLVDGGYSAAVLCNDSEVDMEELCWMCFNYIIGLPLDEMHFWATPTGKAFSEPHMLAGDYIGHEGKVTHCVVSVEDGQLKCTYDDVEKELQYCGDLNFAVFSKDEAHRRENTYKFHIRDGKCWGVHCGSRIFERVN